MANATLVVLGLVPAAIAVLYASVARQIIGRKVSDEGRGAMRSFAL